MVQRNGLVSHLLSLSGLQVCWEHSVLHVRVPKVECRGFSSQERRRAMVHVVQDFAFLLVILSWDINAGQRE